VGSFSVLQVVFLLQRYPGYFLIQVQSAVSVCDVIVDVDVNVDGKPGCEHRLAWMVHITPANGRIAKQSH
jgi:hypothetical protein